MGKRITFLLALGILLALCACGNSASKDHSVNSDSSHTNWVSPNPDGSTPMSSDGSGYSADETGADSDMAAGGLLSLLYMLQGYGKVWAATDSGCYYLSDDEERLPDGRHVSHLMYMDIAARQEIYLCSNAACAHNTVDCTSVLLYDDFPPYTTALFVWSGNLYIMSKEQDHDGYSMATVDFGGDGLVPGGMSIESRSTILYRVNLDGTDRNKVYTFDSNVTVEDFVVGDAGGLYLITKKLTTQQGNGQSYQTSSERKLIYLDLSAKTETEVCSMDFGDHISWDVIGGSGRMLILYGVDFGRYVSPEEMHGDDIRIYDDSYDVFATLNVDNASLHEIYRAYAPKARSYVVDRDKLYFAVHGSGSIIRVDLRTGEEATLCNIAENSIGGMIGDRLYCYGSGHTYYFVDVNTGEISHSGLVNKTTGWSLTLIAEFGDQVLVNYDSDGSFSSYGSFSPTREHYGLIRKEDLYAGIDHFAPISMIGKGIR